VSSPFLADVVAHAGAPEPDEAFGTSRVDAGAPQPDEDDVAILEAYSATMASCWALLTALA
jgi:hypothetical protein